MSKKELSSGAEKAESLERKSSAQKSETKAKTAKTEKAQPVKQTKSTKTSNTKTKSSQKSGKKSAPVKAVNEKKRQRNKKREQKKLEIAKIRAERKQRRLEKKLESKQKRLDRIAALQSAREERRAKKSERRDLLKHETKEMRIERKKQERDLKMEARAAKRKAALEERVAKREHRLKVRAEKRAEKNDKRHAPGFGGWLAAVISLGVTTLALGTMLTFGWFAANGMQADMISTHTQSVYELNSIVDNLDTNLSKARVSNSQNEQVRLLTDIAIESEMAETILERLPMDGMLTGNMTSFVNKMSDSAQSMLYSVASGKKLTDSQVATIEHMYQTNLELKRTLNELTSNFNGKDMLAAMRGKNQGLMFSTFDDIEHNTVETPKEIHDGPFAENIEKVSAKNLEGLEEVSATEAEKLAQEYFKDYDVNDVRCTGETLAEQLECYNLSLITDDGEMHAQLSKKGGKVVEFNSYKDCNDRNFSVERCIDIAQDFLASLGFDHMKAVWTSENGTTCNLNFAYEQDGVVVYPDMIKVKVCEERGIVTGMEGLSYVLNHTERQIAEASISKNEAKGKLHAGLESEGSRLCIIPTDGGEALAYEFYGKYEGNIYYIYIDAATGNELEVFTVIGTKQGKALM